MNRYMSGLVLVVVVMCTGWAWCVEVGGKGEYARYDAGWNGIIAGELEMEDKGEVPDKGELAKFGQVEGTTGVVRYIFVEAKTTKLLRTVYKAERGWRCRMRSDLKPFLFEEWDLAAEPWEKISYLVFDRPGERIAGRYKHGKFDEDVSYPQGAWDPPTALLHWRGRQLKAGERYELDMVEGTSVYHLTFVPKAGPRVRSVLGVVDTLILAPQIEENGEAMTDYTVQVYVQKEVPHIPIRADVRTEWGPIQATLVEYRKPVRLRKK